MRPAAWAFALMGAMASAAHAQVPSNLMVPDAERAEVRALQCLQRPSPQALSMKGEHQDTVGLVRVLLRFESATAAPQAKVLYGNLPEAAQAKVLEHVARYRLPCWTDSTGPVEAVQEFSLAGDSAVLPTAKRQRHEAASGDLAGCKVNTGEALAFRDFHEPGFALVRITFPGQPNQAPTVASKTMGLDRSTVKLIERHIASSYRASCPQPQAFTVQQPWAIHAGGAGLGFANRTFKLTTWLGQVTPASRAPARFDLTTMGCPFVVQLTAYQPLANNGVIEVETPNPQRTAFLEWLRQHRLDLPEKQLRHLLGQSLFIEVPCGTLDLPK